MGAFARKRILLLTDRDGHLTSKVIGDKKVHYRGWADTDMIIGKLSENYDVECHRYNDLDLRRCYKDYYVVYASSENRGLSDKDYMEDVLLRLMEDGAILVPGFKYFRAHHNKSFQEMMRASSKNSVLRTPVSYCYSNAKEVDYEKFRDFPYVIKSSAGTGSNGVRIARNEEELRKIVKKMSSVRYNDMVYDIKYDINTSKAASAIKSFIKHTFMRDKLYRCKRSEMSTKFVIQEFIPNLKGDYKILYYAGKYYVLRRENRKGDFRASGSGKFFYPDEVEKIKSVLTFAKSIAEEFGQPMMSMDIAENDSGCYLVEYQFLFFGTYTLEFSEWYFEYDKDNESWIKKEGCSLLEDEYVRSIEWGIENRKSK